MAAKVTYDRFTFVVLLKDLLEKLNNDIILRSIALGQEASGDTYQQITSSVTPEENVIKGQSTGPSYLEVLEVGRQPGKAPFTFEQIILKWMQDKGITGTDISDEELARRIAWSIRLHGSKLHRDKIYLDVYDTLVNQFANNAANALADAALNQVSIMIDQINTR